MSTPELVLAVLGGVVAAALLCWIAVTAALHVARRGHAHGRGAHGPRGPRAF